MIKISNQDSMIEFAECFLHQEGGFSQAEVYKMDDFEKYYQGRELLRRWNHLSRSENERKAKIISLYQINFEYLDLNNFVVREF